ncbi:ABC transporter substrate-binding protein [Actinomadura sp. 9N407]|uniref:ABC transporter substrate-binding protein n=1 Tax=Actinomadura sp. 9N407 TaxID=3375154 RepID=UPI00379CBB00
MKRRMAIAAVAVLGLTAACGTGEGGGKADDGVLKVGAVFAQTTLDPALLPLRQMAMYTAPLYDSLTFLASDESVEPRLATAWTPGSDDKGPYLDMTLRDGLAFPDGTAFTSKTVAVNVKRSQTLKGSTNAPQLAGVTVEERGTTKVRFRADGGVGALPRILAGSAGQMISDKAIADGTDLTRASAGIGPFSLQRVQANRVVYTAAKGYWDTTVAAAGTLEINYLADDAKLNAVRSGDLDISILPEKMIKTAESAGYKIERSTGSENYLFSFNTAMKPFDDIRVRKAVNFAIDRDAICTGLLDGKCKPNGQFFGAGTKAYAPQAGLKLVPYDIAKAKSLVAEAGAAGAKVEIVTVAGNQVFEQLATIVQEQLKTIGLDASVSAVAPPQVVSRFTAEKNVAMAFGATGNAFDPSDTLNRYGLAKGLYNPGGLKNPKVEKLAGDALRETDQAERMKIYQEISGVITESMMNVPVLTPETAYVIAPGVSGWKAPWAPSFPSFRGVKG